MSSKLHIMHHSEFTDLVLKSFIYNAFIPSKSDPYKVSVYRSNTQVIISSKGYNKIVKMKNRWWWVFTGRTWEEEVRRAQQDAFEATYTLQKKEEMLDYEVERLKK